MNCDTIATDQARLTTDELSVLDAKITRVQMKTDIHQYTSLPSRHVSHPGNLEAAGQLFEDLYTIGKGRLWLRPETFQLTKGRKGQQPFNVEAMLSGVNSSEVIIVAAHLDCTADRDPSYRPAMDPAAGADDDASGIGGVLAAARAIVALSAIHPPGVPRAEIRFVLFNAEEQAQRGSRVYAKRERNRGTHIAAVYQMDMIGYRKRGDNAFEVHAGFKRNPAVQAASLELADHLVEICATADIPLTPQVYFHRPRKRDPGQGFSDHTSFHRRGFPAVMVSENFFPGQDSSPSPGYPNPDYHLPEDKLDNLDPGYAATIARAVTAAAWHRATRFGWMQRDPSAVVHQRESHEHDVPEPHEH